MKKDLKEILLNVVNTDDLGQLCFSYLRDQINVSNKLTVACESYFDNLDKVIPVQINAAQRLGISRNWSES